MYVCIVLLHLIIIWFFRNMNLCFSVFSESNEGLRKMDDILPLAFLGIFTSLNRSVRFLAYFICYHADWFSQFSVKDIWKLSIISVAQIKIPYCRLILKEAGVKSVSIGTSEGILHHQIFWGLLTVFFFSMKSNTFSKVLKHLQIPLISD